jgi:hypothetical protein
VIVPRGLKGAPLEEILAWCADQEDPRLAVWLVRCGLPPPEVRSPPWRAREGRELPGMTAMERYLAKTYGKDAQDERKRPSLLFGGRAGIPDDAPPSWDDCVRAMEEAIGMR